ncbi:MAG: hypothetical protein ACXAEL_12515 [Candidatus Hodarchaeales archaeon]|jgi:hypothetical protein
MRQICHKCGGSVRPSMERVSLGHLSLEMVPHERCIKCGEQYFSEEVMRHLEVILRETRALEKLPIRDEAPSEEPSIPS